jgi:outer membrane protein assembly factor BamE (lipoprotein component of BamABCDE complex)
MKKSIITIAALLAVISVAGCTTVGKAPVGKGPVVAKY